MKLKSLAIAAATLAVGAITSQAQVYSQNIVGYVNAPTVAGQYVLLCNPLDDGTNTLNSLASSAGIGSLVQVWNGAGYTQCSKSPVGWSPNASIPVGKGLFLRTTIPFAENLGGTNLNLVPGIGSLAQIWNGAGYTQCSKSPVGWSPNPVITTGQGFFVRPTVTYNWIQTSP